MGRVIEPIMNRLFFMTMLMLAPRPKELEYMKLQDVTLRKEGEQWRGAGTKPAEGTKKKRRHVVPIPPRLAELFANWMYVRSRESDWMFPGRAGEPCSKQNWHYRWDEIRSQAGIPHIWQYDLRRTGATWANDETGNLSAVSRWMLGHVNLQATNLYGLTLWQTVEWV